MQHSTSEHQQGSLDLVALVSDYYSINDVSKLAPVAFGTSGHRGKATRGSFNELHIASITQAVCDYRKQNGITGPLFLGKDTHALSEPAQRTAISVLAANQVKTVIQANNQFTPTPVISFHILQHNQQAKELADGIVITPSHNPPEDGGFKYNEPHGGPADVAATQWIQDKANQYLQASGEGVQRVDYAAALASECIREESLQTEYVAQLESVIDMQAIRDANIKLIADPLGGATVAYWKAIQQHFELTLDLANETVDPTFSFMPNDHDGKIRMDCSSAAAMAGLLPLNSHYDLGFANDPDGDRHGIVTPAGLMNPNHFLAVAIHYLATHRRWPSSIQIGKTLVSSSMIDRVAEALKLPISEVPVGFKWFVSGLHEGVFAFAGEESAGATFLRRDASCWSTDKDGIILCLLAAEILAVTGKTPTEYYHQLTEQFGSMFYKRVDAPATPEQKAILKKLTAEDVTQSELAGAPILAVYTHASGNNAAIGGVKVVTKDGWFAARPSGTEDVYKIYAESCVSAKHLNTLIAAAEGFVSALF